MSGQAEHPEPVVTVDAAGRRITQHAFPAPELIAAECAERAARAVRLAERDPFTRIPQTDDESPF